MEGCQLKASVSCILDPQGQVRSRLSITRSTRFSSFFPEYTTLLTPILPEPPLTSRSGCPVASAQLTGQAQNSPSALVEEQTPTLQPHQTSQPSKLTRPSNPQLQACHPRDGRPRLTSPGGMPPPGCSTAVLCPGCENRQRPLCRRAAHFAHFGTEDSDDEAGDTTHTGGREVKPSCILMPVSVRQGEPLQNG